MYKYPLYHILQLQRQKIEEVGERKLHNLVNKLSLEVEMYDGSARDPFASLRVLYLA
jgi:hypothetical protein